MGSWNKQNLKDSDNCTPWGEPVSPRQPRDQCGTRGAETGRKMKKVSIHCGGKGSCCPQEKTTHETVERKKGETIQLSRNYPTREKRERKNPEEGKTAAVRMNNGMSKIASPPAMGRAGKRPYHKKNQMH